MNTHTHTGSLPFSLRGKQREKKRKRERETLDCMPGSAKVFCQSAIESAQSDHATLIQNMLDNKACWDRQGMQDLPLQLRDLSTEVFRMLGDEW